MNHPTEDDVRYLLAEMGADVQWTACGVPLGPIFESWLALRGEAGKAKFDLIGVMHSVDKWLDGKDLEENLVHRAARAREVALQALEKQEAELVKLEAERERTEAALRDVCKLASLDDKPTEFANRVMRERLAAHGLWRQP